MADIKQCEWVIPHLRHNWMEQSVLPYGHRQYHHCEGVEGMSSLDDITPPSYDSSIQQGGNMSDAVKVLRKEIARSKIEEGTVVRFERDMKVSGQAVLQNVPGFPERITYAAIYGGGRWYFTGRGHLGTATMTNRDFIDRLSRSDISNIEVATAFESVSGDDSWG